MLTDPRLIELSATRLFRNLNSIAVEEHYLGEFEHSRSRNSKNREVSAAGKYPVCGYPRMNEFDAWYHFGKGMDDEVRVGDIYVLKEKLIFGEEDEDVEYHEHVELRLKRGFVVGRGESLPAMSMGVSARAQPYNKPSFERRDYIKIGPLWVPADLSFILSTEEFMLSESAKRRDAVA